MKIGIVSDSHGNRKALETALKVMGQVDLLFHLGDYWDDGLYLRTLTEAPVHVVKGNMDFYSKMGHEEILTTIKGVRIFASHGHQYDVKTNLQRLYGKARQEAVRIALFGHTHQPYLNDDGLILMMNPGSVGAARSNGDESYGVISISDDKIKGEIFRLNED